MKCPYCGADNVTPGTPCPFCGGNVASDAQPASATGTHQTLKQEQPVKEYVITGTFGALIGSLLGVASIVLFSQFNFVSALSGLILAFCTLKGYQILGQKLSNLGIVICVLVMLVAPLIAYIINLSIYSYNQFGFTFAESIQLIMNLISSGEIGVSDIVMDNLMVYLFTALGAFGIISNAIRANKQ